MSAVFTSLLAIAGVIVGATAQFLFTRYRAHEDRALDQRTQAYTTYMEGIGSVGVAAKSGDAEFLKKSNELLMIARGRISIYRSNSVVKALANFEELGGQLTSDQQAKSFVNLVSKMREDASSDSVPISELSHILLFSDVFKNA